MSDRETGFVQGSVHSVIRGLSCRAFISSVAALAERGLTIPESVLLRADELIR